MKSRLMLGLVLLLVSYAEATATFRPPTDRRFKDAKQPVPVRVKSLVDQMTLEEKIGQMAQIDMKQVTPEIVRDYSIGSLVGSAGSTPLDLYYNSNRTSKLPWATPEEWVDMVNYFQKGSLSSRLGIPYIHSSDAVHGHNNLYGSTIFPHNIGLGATRDREIVRKIGAATAIETRATGISYALAPCVAVCRDPRWGRCFESYGEDPKMVKDMTDIILGLQGEIPPNSLKGVPYVGGKDKVIACAKHYVGDGGTERGINENNTETNWQGLLSIHMPGYYQSIKKGVSTIMVSYSSWNGVKMHANKDLITGFLKETLKFKGFVITDWQGIDKIDDPIGPNMPSASLSSSSHIAPPHYSSSLSKAINAGIDMVMVPPNITEFQRVMSFLVKTNSIPLSRIDDAVSRILRVKFTLGIFEKPLADYSLISQIGTQAHKNLARAAVRKSLVLLKNGKNGNNPLLPLPKNTSRILVAGSHANNLGLQCGGWTNSWQGQSNNNLTIGTTILSGIASTVDPNTEIVYSHNPNSTLLNASNYSYAIVVVGEPQYAETVGDSKNLTIPEDGINTIKNACNATKCVVVLISGRPLLIEPYLENIDALVAAWLPGTEGGGVADVLFGDHPFTGKLPMTWFKNVDQLPMNSGDKNYDPLFPYGHGLTTNKLNGS